MFELQALWFFLIAVVIAGYFILDGFDLGVGVLSPFLAKTEEEGAILRRSIGPVWDGNEVWLLTAGGALFAAFPAAYATTFSGFYLAVMLVLFGLILRVVSLEFRGFDSKWGKLWDVCFFIGSLLPALLLGVAIGNVIQGIPMEGNGDYMGVPLLGLLSPFTLICGVLGLCMMLCAGAAWIAQKAPKPSDLQQRANNMLFPLQVITLVVFALTTILALGIYQVEITSYMFPLCVIFAILYVVAVVISMMQGKKDANLVAFVAQSAAAFLLVGVMACTLFPNLVVASADSIGASITIMSAASSDLTLTWMAGITCIGLPLLLIYHVLAYRAFRGRITPADLEH